MRKIRPLQSKRPADCGVARVACHATTFTWPIGFVRRPPASSASSGLNLSKYPNLKETGRPLYMLFVRVGAASGKGAGIVSSPILGREPIELRSVAVQRRSGNPFSP
jgi:hypothetical protein